MIKLSIVTVNYNDSFGLDKTLESVREQVFSNEIDVTVQLIVVDGASSDDSVNVAHSYGNLIDLLISENDTGIYDAMNKGLKHCDGDFVLFLNSGDFFYCDSTLEQVFRSILRDDDFNTVYFWKAKNVMTDNNRIVTWDYPENDLVGNDLLKWLKSNLPNHQSMLFPYCFYSKNFYDSRLKIIADADYKSKAIAQCGARYVANAFSCFDIGGVSSSKIDFKKYKQLVMETYIFNKLNTKGIDLYKQFLISFIKLTAKFFLSVILKKSYLEFKRG